MRKFLVAGLSAMLFSLAACHHTTSATPPTAPTVNEPAPGRHIPEGRRHFTTSHDTPIIITGGSIELDADTPWTANANNTIFTATTAPIVRISVVNRDNAEKERDCAKTHSKPWTIHLKTVNNHDVKIDSPQLGTTNVSASPGMTWNPTNGGKSITLNMQAGDTISAIKVTRDTGDRPMDCKTDGDLRPGWCKINLRVKDSAEVAGVACQDH